MWSQCYREYRRERSAFGQGASKWKTSRDSVIKAKAKAKGKGKTKTRKNMLKRKEVPRHMTLTLQASVGTVASGDTRRPSAGSRRDKEVNLRPFRKNIWESAFRCPSNFVCSLCILHKVERRASTTFLNESFEAELFRCVDFVSAGV